MGFDVFWALSKHREQSRRSHCLGILLLSLCFLSACNFNLFIQDKSSTQRSVDSIPAQFESKPSLSILDAQATEGIGSETGRAINQMKFVVTINQPSEQVVNFKYATFDGSAKSSLNDFRNTVGVGVIAPGSTTVEISVDLFADSFKEGSETFQLVVSNISGALLQDSVGQGTIIDEDQSAPAAYLSRMNRNIYEASGASLIPWATGMEAWTKRVKLTILGKWQSGVTNFPVLVKLNPQRVNYSEFKPDGSDLVFLDEDSLTVLPYEIEIWNPAGDSFVWVKVPAINSNSTSDHFWMYYGNPLAISSVVAADVWDSDFVGVWHLSNLTNSTITPIAGTNHGALASTGIAGGSFYFDGIAAYLDFGNPAVLPAGTSSRTLCAWANPQVMSASSSFLASYGSNTTKQAFSLGFNFKNAFGDFNVNTKVMSAFEVVKQDQWSEYCFTFDGSTARIFVNGNYVSENHGLSTWSLVRNLFYIGRGINGTGYLNGKIDEVRLSKSVRSHVWLNLEYAAVRDSLLHYGAASSVNSQGSEYFEIKLDAPSNEEVIVPYEISGSASFGTDHNLSSGFVSMPPGQTSVQIPFNYYRERAIESDETIVVTLAEPTGAGRIADSTEALTLVDEPNSLPIIADRIVTLGPQEITTIDLMNGASDSDGDPLVVQMVGSTTLVNRSISDTFLQLTGMDSVGSSVVNVIISDGNSSVTKSITVNVTSPSTWTGAAGDGLWSNPGNWSGLQVPSANSRVYFEGAACGTHCDVTINTNVNVRFIGMGSSYLGTITQQGGNTITIGATGLGGFIQNGGSFLGGTGPISISGPTRFEVGSFRATSGTLTFAAPPIGNSIMLDFGSGFNFQHNNGTVVLVAPNADMDITDCDMITATQVQFNNLTITSGALANWSAVNPRGSPISVLGNFVSTGNRAVLFAAEIHLHGNFYQTNNSTYSMSGSDIIFEGPGLQTYSCSGTCRAMHKFTINKTSGSVEPLDANPVAVTDFELRSGTFKASSSIFRVGGMNRYAGPSYSRDKLFTVNNGTNFIPNGGTLAFERSLENCSFNSEGTFLLLPTDQYFTVNNLSFLIHPFANKCASWNNTYILPSTYGFRVLGNAHLGYGKLISGNLLVEGDVTISTGLEANSTTSLSFVGNNQQTWTHSAGNMILGTITIDKPSGQVTLGSNMTLNPGQNLNLVQGTLNQAASPTGFSLAVPGILTLQPSTTINQMGGALTYGTLLGSGTINP
jgi:hypothetical protein